MVILYGTISYCAVRSLVETMSEIVCAQKSVDMQYKKLCASFKLAYSLKKELYEAVVV